MDINDLNKSQLLLLAVLLSFVTSIATGITTVTLMQQAPESVTVPINRVVRETVEKIVPVPGKTQTVVVKEEDLVVDAIAKNQGATFSLNKEIENLEAETKIEENIGRSFAVSKNGIVVTDSKFASGPGNYFLINSSGKFQAEFIYADPLGFSFLKIGAPLDGTSKVAYSVPDFGVLDNMKAGQKVLVLGSTILSTIYEGDKNINTNVLKANSGGLVLNLDGEALGVALMQEGKTFAPIEAINESLKANASNL